MWPSNAVQSSTTSQCSLAAKKSPQIFHGSPATSDTPSAHSRERTRKLDVNVRSAHSGERTPPIFSKTLQRPRVCTRMWPAASRAREASEARRNCNKMLNLSLPSPLWLAEERGKCIVGDRRNLRASFSFWRQWHGEVVYQGACTRGTGDLRQEQIRVRVDTCAHAEIQACPKKACGKVLRR